VTTCPVHFPAGLSRGLARGIDGLGGQGTQVGMRSPGDKVPGFRGDVKRRDELMINKNPCQVPGIEFDEESTKIGGPVGSAFPTVLVHGIVNMRAFPKHTVWGPWNIQYRNSMSVVSAALIAVCADCRSLLFQRWSVRLSLS